MKNHTQRSIRLKCALLLVSVVTSTFIAHAQAPGQWVLKKAHNVIDFAGDFGTQGVAAPTNFPPALTMPCEWTDNAGNFWIYGGATTDEWKDDLWKYEPATGNWTWVQGHQSAPYILAVYGTQNVAAASNTPGVRVGSNTWTDNAGNLWLFGGTSLMSSPMGGGSFNDLWKYDIATGFWTWMKGDTGAHGTARYGIKGVEDPANKPRSLYGSGINWKDNTGNLWLLTFNGALWRYNMGTNNWIWMKGDTINYPLPVYGTTGVADAANTPGSSANNYARWTDSHGNLWYLDGRGMNIWKYDVSGNAWTWYCGDQFYPYESYYTSRCSHPLATINYTQPQTRFEDRACWIDACDNLWLMGGGTDIAYNDLIYFDTEKLQWVWADNDTVPVGASVFGAVDVPHPGNMPSSRKGAVPFTDAAGHLWMYGGANVNGTHHFAELWMYTIDTACTRCHATLGTTSNVQEAPGITIYPNPSSSIFTITAKDETISYIAATNIMGQSILSMQCTGNVAQIDLSGYSRGVYYLHLYSRDNGVVVRKILLE